MDINKIAKDMSTNIHENNGRKLITENIGGYPIHRQLSQIAALPFLRGLNSLEIGHKLRVISDWISDNQTEAQEIIRLNQEEMPEKMPRELDTEYDFGGPDIDGDPDIDDDLRYQESEEEIPFGSHRVKRADARRGKLF